MFYTMVEILGAAVCIWFIFKHGEAKPWYDLSLLLLGLLVGSLIQKFINSGGRMRLALWCSWLTISRRKLRISIAYLVRIECDNKYLLIKNERFNKFQPVGGVYQYYEESTMNRLHLGLDHTGLKDIPKNDLRRVFLNPESSFFIFRFLRWFESQKERETSPHREFLEELVDSKILDSAVFSKLSFNFIRRYEKPVTWVPQFRTHEFKLFDIYSFRASAEQETELRKLLNVKRDDICWVDRDQVERAGFSDNGELPLGEHTHHIL